MSDQQQDQRPDAEQQAPSSDPAAAHRFPERPQQQQPGGARPKRRRRLPFVIFGLVVLIAAVAGFWWWFAHRNELTTDDAFTDGNAVTVAPRVSGQVVSLDVNDNQFVRAGQLLIQIDPRDYIASRDEALARLQSVKAQAINAEANSQIIRVTAPARLTQAKAQLAEAEANEFKTARNYARFHDINPAATTREDVDSATAAQRQAQAQVAQAQAQVESANTVLQEIQQAEAQIRQLKGQSSQAQAELDQANLNLSYTQVHAPQAGWIAKRNVDMGNYVQVGTTIFSIVTQPVWVTANFKENELLRMRPGDQVDIHVDAYPNLKLRGHVDSVQLGSGSEFSAFPAENATGNFVKIVQRVPVKIDIDSGLDPNLPLPLGISVEPTVHVR